MIPECFHKKHLSEESLLFCFDLNNVPSSSDQILKLAQLINFLEKENYICSVKQDKRLRANGLLVVFANTQAYYKNLKQKRSQMLKVWDIQK